MGSTLCAHVSNNGLYVTEKSDGIFLNWVRLVAGAHSSVKVLLCNFVVEFFCRTSFPLSACCLAAILGSCVLYGVYLVTLGIAGRLLLGTLACQRSLLVLLRSIGFGQTNSGNVVPWGLGFWTLTILRRPLHALLKSILALPIESW
jgi:hypothetical protein